MRFFTKKRAYGLLLPLLCCALTASAQQHPQFTDTGNPTEDSARYAQGLAQYAQAKRQTAARMSVATAEAPSKAAPKSLGSATARLASQSCLIPRDASWIQIPVGDDNSSAVIPLGFTFDLYGQSYSNVYINTNGNVTFTGALNTYNASGFPFNTAILAPFWADVETSTCGGVYYKKEATRMIVTWENVGYYSVQCGMRNTFQVVFGTTNDPVIGLGQNVLFNYGDMQWTTGQASGSQNGFGGTAATVGINKGDNVNYVQIGRFNVNGANYDGGGGTNDGINYLDYQCFSFNVSTAGNIPPSFSGFPTGNTVTVNCGETANFTIQSLPPEVNQVVTTEVNTGGVSGISANVTNGAVSTATLTVSGQASNVGTHTVTFTATDNGSPAKSATQTLTVVVLPPPSASITLSGPATFCVGGSVTLSAPAGAAGYLWSNGATTSSIDVSATGTYTVTVTGTGGCSSTSDPVTVTVHPKPVVSIGASGATSFCPGGSVTLTASGADSYSWSTGATSASISTGQTGTYTVTGTTNGCSGTASATVNATDATPPSISCPGNQTLASCATTIPAYGLSALASDNCTPAGALTITQVPAAGTAIAAGSTVTVTLTVKDAAGNQGNSCTFTVTRPNITPVAGNDAASVCSGSSVTIDVLANDTHPQGSSLSVNDFATPSVGTLVKTADNKLLYTAPAGYSGPVTFTYTTKASDATIGFSGNGHYYEWVPSSGITWTNARAQASNRTYNGLKGYLVTITSAAEMTFVRTKLQGSGWMGASDLAFEGQWRWVTGPEGLENNGAGRHFSNQSKTGNCSANWAPGINGNYANWATAGEPNDCGANVGQFNPMNVNRGGEHYAHFYGDGIWNDFPNSVGGNIAGYVVEYGGLEGCIPELTASATVTVTVKALPTTSVSASSLDICPGTSSTLTASGADTYVWNTGATGATLVVTAPGTYTVTGTSNGCTGAPASVQIKQNTAPAISGVNPYLQAFTAANSCTAVVNYPVAASGIPAPGVSYSFTGATSGSGNGTGSGRTFNKGVTHVVVTATNGCATATASFDVTVVDNVKPVASCKSATVYLDGNGKASVTAAQLNNNSSDNCSPVSLSVVKSGIICGIAAENGTITLQAPAGTVIDRIDFASYGTPTGSCGNFVQGWCHAGNSKAVVEGLALNQNSFSVQASNLVFGDPCFGTVKRLVIQAHYTGVSTSSDFDCSNLGDNAVTLVVTDADGNVSTCTSTVTVLDAIAPVPQLASLPVVTGQCSATATAPLATDNCAGTVVATTADPVTYTQQGTYTITWTYSDGNGNSTTQQQTVTIADTEQPVLTDVPASTTVSCDAVPAAAQPGATDNCDAAPAVTLAETSTQDAAPNAAGHYNYTITRTWTATDHVGNTSSATQTITVQDITAPVVTCPGDKTLNCQDDASTTANGVATATDNCAPVSITHSDVSTQSADVNSPAHYNYTISRTWTATDVSGNATTCVQTITVQDVTAPVMTCPASVTLSCEADNSTAANGVATATDNCAPVAIAYSDVSTQVADVNSAAHYNYVITRTWKAADVSGNATTCIQTLTVQDVTAPVITTAAGSMDRTEECSDNKAIADALALVPAASDNCAPVTLHLVSDVKTAACGATYTRVRTWNFTDVSGNTSAVFTQTLTVVDRTAPVVTYNVNAVEHCYDTTSTHYTVAAIVATDNCTAVTYSYAVSGPGGFTRTGTGPDASGTFAVGMNTISWTMKDACGNTTTAVTTVRLNAPILGTFNSFTVLQQGALANTIYLGYTPASTAAIKVTATGGTAPYTYSWVKSSGSASFTPSGDGSTIQVTAAAAGTVTFSVTVTDSKGCKAVFTKTIRVIDVRCGNKNDKVLVCHATGSASNPYVQICVAPSAVPAQLGNGSYLGTCTGTPATTRSEPKAPKAVAAIEASVVAFPNPSRGLVSLRISGLSGKLTVEVWNAQGAVVTRRETTATPLTGMTLDLQTVAGGLYTIRITDGKQVLSTRVTIAR
ncbi:nidogen-like domain-containing protein [Flaviaesturariibacter amylovorans]|uniref:HYR domain-containing protein n=1 Tax=Flaviaesturariibacter amylovorans TaxID=1084520 RepID=A0ABP8HNE9_9BACT